MGVPWNVVYRVWRSIPPTVRDGVRRTSPLPLREVFADHQTMRPLPIRYGDLSMEILIPVHIDTPWLNYHRRDRPYHEPLATRTYVHELAPGDVFWDLGSRLGYEAAVAAELVGDPANVHVFEAQEFRVRQVQRLNREQFGGAMTVNHCLVGDGGFDASGLEHPGEVVQLDQYAEAHGPPDFVKMDIEGAEVAAVDSFAETIAQSHPTLLIEVHPERIDESDPSGQTRMVDLLLDEYETLLYCEDFRSDDAEWILVDRSLSLDTQYQLLCKGQD